MIMNFHYNNYIRNKWYCTVNNASYHHGNSKKDAFFRNVVKNGPSGNYPKKIKGVN